MSRKTRKLIWSAPLLAVFAVVGALVAFGALGIGGVFAHDAPGTPQKVTVSPADGPAGRTTLVLDWKEPDEGVVDRYRIDVSKDGGKFTYHTSTTETTYTHEGLKASTKRYYRVFAVSDTAGAGPVSRDVSATTSPTTKPGKVALNLPTAQGPTQINLVWQMPDNGGAAISRYCIAANQINAETGAVVDGEVTITADTCSATATTTAGDNDEINKVIIVNAPDTSYEHKSLAAEQTWRYQVYAFNSQGYSRLSSDQRQATTDEAARPAAPTMLTLVQEEDAGTDDPVVQLYWNGPTTNGGQDIVGYRIEVTDTQGHWPDPPATATASFTDNVTADGDFTPVGATDARSTVAYDIPPAAAPSDGGIAYQLQHTLDHTDVGYNFVGKTLYYRVRTETGPVADREVSFWSSTFGRVTIVDDEDRLNRVFATVADATEADMNKTGEIKLTFSGTMRDQPGADADTPVAAFNDPSGYRVDISTDMGVTWRTEQKTTNRIDGNEYEQRDVKPGDTLRFRVFAWDGSTLGIASVVASGTAGPVRIPGKVTSLAANAPALPVGAGQINLSWATPANDGGGGIKLYCIEVNRINADGVVLGTPAVIGVGNCSATMDPTGNKTANDVIIIDAEDADGNMVTRYEHKGLRAENRWSYRVSAVNSAGFAVGSDKVDEATGKATTAPAPENLTTESAHDSNSVPAGTRGVVLLWTTPADPPGAPVTGYRVQRSIGDSMFETVRSTEFTHWVDRQQPVDGEVRAYRIASVNAVGQNETSYSEIKMRVEGTGDDQMLILVPEHGHNAAPTTVGTISDVTVMVDGMRTSTMAASSYFSDADGDTLTITASSGDDTVATAMVNTNGMIVVTGVAVGSTTVTVTADDSNGGMVLQTFMVTVEAADTTPTAPSGVMANIDATAPDGTDVIVTWTDGANAEGHGVLLFTADFSLTDHIARGLGGSHTFENVAAGSYIAVVVVLDAQGGLVTDANGDYLYAGAESTVMVQP